MLQGAKPNDKYLTSFYTGRLGYNLFNFDLTGAQKETKFAICSRFALGPDYTGVFTIGLEFQPSLPR